MHTTPPPSGTSTLGTAHRPTSLRHDGFGDLLPAQLRGLAFVLLFLAPTLGVVGCQPSAGDDAPPAKERPLQGAGGGRGDQTQLSIGVGAVRGRPGYESLRRGLDLAVERLNGTSPLRFRLRLPDSGLVSAVRVAQQLASDPEVIGVVGHPESGHSLEAIPVYADAEHGGRNGVVAISPTASSPRLSGISPWFFRMAPSDETAARFVARWVRDSLGARRAAVIYRNDSYGRDWASTFSTAFVSDQTTIVARDPYLTGVTEWDAYAQRLAVLRPDVLLFPGDVGDATELLRALQRARVELAFIGGDGTAGMRDSSVANGARYVAFFQADQIETEEGRTFARQYAAKYGVAPDMFAALSYDAALAIGRSAIQGATTRIAVRRALERLGSTGAPTLEGVAGRIAFEKNHDIAGRTVLISTVRTQTGRP